MLQDQQILTRQADPQAGRTISDFTSSFEQLLNEYNHDVLRRTQNGDDDEEEDEYEEEEDDDDIELTTNHPR